jgi:hypothetical protein
MRRSSLETSFFSPRFNSEFEHLHAQHFGLAASHKQFGSMNFKAFAFDLAWQDHRWRRG